jgi:hypothetical protein
MSAEKMNLSERALHLKFDTVEALAAPMARLLPGPVMRIVKEQAEVLAALAEQVRRLECLIDVGEADE